MLGWSRENCGGCPRRRRRQLPRFQIVTLEELISSAKPIEYICEPILPKRSLVLLVGKGGVGKSLTCLHVAGAVSSGGRIFGRFECEKTRVLIIDEENTASVYKQRAKLLGLDSLKNIDVINLQDFQLTDQSHFEFLREILRERGYGLIIIDCWTNVVPGIDENKAGEVADILKRLRRLAYEYDATLLVIHHSRKNIAYPVEEIDEPRGSTVLVNEPDMVYLMSKEKMGEGRIVKTVKARYGNEVAFRLAFKQSDGRLKIEWKGELGKKEVESKVQVCARNIKGLLKELGREASRKEILEAVRGFPPRIVDRSLQYLVRIGEVERVTRGVYRLKTDSPNLPNLYNNSGENGEKLELNVDHKINSYLAKWSGFHAVGRTTPEKAYHKTVQALLEYVNIEKTNIIEEADLVKVLDCYWRRESHERVKQKLINDGYINPIASGKYLIAQK